MKNILNTNQMNLKPASFSDDILKDWIENEAWNEPLAKKADAIRRQSYGTEVYFRGLIELTNYCKNNCYYCGIRCGNPKVDRYRLTYEDIMSCCEEGYELGFRTFVLQGGEDPYYTDDIICQIISGIKHAFPDCAVTLSIGEKSRESYQKYFDVGADRYLLREETSNESHYQLLHPESMSMKNRQRCLKDLKEIGYQVGAGFMVDSPYQTTEDIIADLRFLEELQPDMIGIGPFITHKDTPFAKHPSGSVSKTIRLISILRILFPNALLPATTALGTLDPLGREKGLQAGANVVMPNLSPAAVREKYNLYNGKIYSGDESAQARKQLEKRVEAAGYHVVNTRGDVAGFQVMNTCGDVAESHGVNVHDKVSDCHAENSHNENSNCHIENSHNKSSDYHIENSHNESSNYHVTDVNKTFTDCQKGKES